MAMNIAAAALLGAFLMSASPQDPPSGGARTFEALLEKMGSDAPAERDAAMAELLKLGTKAVPLLKEALKSTEDAETRARLELVLSELDLPDLSTFYAGRRRDGTGETDKAVRAALQWLARHQNPDGSWSADAFGQRCTAAKCAGPGERDYDLGITALTLLAFLGDGYTQDSRDEEAKFGEIVKSGLKWLLARQDREGCIGERGMKYCYNHALATLVLAEAFGMTRSESLKAPAQKAVDFLAAAQNPGKGWRYSSRCGDNDSSVTGWAMMALELAHASGLKVPKAAGEGALAWFDDVTEQNGYYRVGYNARGTGKVYIPGRNEEFDHHETMTAAGIVARIFITRRTTAPELGGHYLLLHDLPTWAANRIDSYYWYFGSLALFQYDGPDGRMWKRWNTAMVQALIPNQKAGADGCAAGSWDPKGDRWGQEGGRVYITAMNALTLETSFRYPSFSGFKKRAQR
jgi:hypothetical protein